MNPKIPTYQKVIELIDDYMLWENNYDGIELSL